MFDKQLHNNESPTNLVNQITDQLIEAKKSKSLVIFETDNFKKSKERIIEYNSKVVIDGGEIIGINSQIIDL